MGELLSCPFCRELFSDKEGRRCPECDLPLVPLSRLPLSLAGRAEANAEPIDPPWDQRLPVWFLGRGRGAISLLSLLGFWLFFQPWVTLDRPDPVSLSGRDLAASTAPWLWGGAVGWFILFALVLSRRSVQQMRGVRAIATLFCALTGGEVAMLLFRPPAGHEYFSSGLEYAWGLYASGVVALVACGFCLRLGGSLEDFRDLRLDDAESGPRTGESLH